MTLHNQSRGSGGNKNTCSRSQSRKFWGILQKCLKPLGQTPGLRDTHRSKQKWLKYWLAPLKPSIRPLGQLRR